MLPNNLPLADTLLSLLEDVCNDNSSPITEFVPVHVLL